LTIAVENAGDELRVKYEIITCWLTISMQAMMSDSRLAESCA